MVCVIPVQAPLTIALTGACVVVVVVGQVVIVKELAILLLVSFVSLKATQYVAAANPVNVLETLTLV